jgi:hypothetical protein
MMSGKGVREATTQGDETGKGKERREENERKRKEKKKKGTKPMANGTSPYSARLRLGRFLLLRLELSP